ncbi:hypothetical protein OROGR_000217 [Orobanche gracilis]
MSYYKDIKFTLKVVINRQNPKVLFAEADSVFADVLLSFLSLPLGTIVRLLQKHYGDEAPVIGSLTTLSNGLSDLDISNFWNEGRKRMLLNPISSFYDDDTDRATKYFCCEDWDCVFSKKTNMSMYYGIGRCDCRRPLIREVPMRNASRNDGGGDDDDDDGFFVVRGTTFITSDDLLIMPNAAGSVIRILGDLGINDADWGEMKDVTFGFNEIMDLLKCSLLSRTPLTDIVLNKGQITFATPTESGLLLPKVERKKTHDSDTMILRVMIQKSTNSLLFAQVEEDFIDVLFSLLIIPLGGVECLLDGNTCLKNIDNLYKSVKDLSNDKYLDADKALYSLIDPKVPHGYISDNQILPIEEEEGPRKVYYYRGSGPHDDFVSLSHDMGGSCVKVISPKFQKGQNSYVKGPRMYVVNDDLSVKPSCMASYLSNLNGLKIPISDVNELVLHVGLEETLSILKASLSSNSALSNGLKHLLKKKPKQEH